jgi:hypothetical protein
MPIIERSLIMSRFEVMKSVLAETLDPHGLYLDYLRK